MDSRMVLLARMRGTFVGLIAWAAGIAGHGLGGGSMALTEADLLLPALGCAAIGALVTPGQVRSNNWLPLLALLGTGQLLGHILLTFSHSHAMPIAPRAPMVAAHVAVMIAAAVLLRAAEHAILWAVGMARGLLAPASGPEPAVPLWVAITSSQNWAATLLLWCSVAVTRGPPRHS